MTLIKSVSGIRGTIGGPQSENLTPPDIVAFVSAYAGWLKKVESKKHYKVVLGRDARVSGMMLKNLVSGTLVGLGIDVIDLDLATTPTVELCVTDMGADGGIILTASHNPFEWNALKLLNKDGEFISKSAGQEIVELAGRAVFHYAEARDLGSMEIFTKAGKRHIEKILDLPLVNVQAIRKAGFKVVLDCVNSVGGIILPELLRALGVSDIIELHCVPSGEFPHDPEPIPINLGSLSNAVVNAHADLGFAVDPDVDRLAIVCEDGSFFGEEYTLVAVADYVLRNQPGPTVSNLSSTRALKDLSDRYHVKYSFSAVGEVHVVETMKESKAVIGGEGNGGVIYPELHYGRDALVGIALFLSSLAENKKKITEIKKDLPGYSISKDKIKVDPEFDFEKFLLFLRNKYIPNNVIQLDGLKLEFNNEWIHIRKSNTEPVVRVIAEGLAKNDSDRLVKEVIDEIKKF